MTSGTEERAPLLLAGRWELDHPHRVLGSGRYAQTLAGTDLESGDPVAVKLLNEIVPAGARERFLREAQVHAQLDHPAILPLLDHGREGERHFIVTPLMRQGALGNVVHARADGCLSPSMTLRIGRRMADTLVYLREQRKTHGDISPGNILVDDHDQAFLADFGYSKAAATIPLATTGDRFGTDGYRSPRPPDEQRTYDDDVYSLAAVLWFCLTGDSPIHGRRDLPRPLRTPLERGLRWESMPSAAAFRADIEKHWSRFEHDWREMSSLSPRSRVPLIAALGVAGLLATGVGGRALRAAPEQLPQTTLHGPALTLHLGGSWQERLPPAVAGVQLTSALSATNADTQVTAGLSKSAGVALISERAIDALPASARTPRKITVDGRAALRYGPAQTATGRLSEIIAVPLERSALVISCDGAGALTTLSGACAKAAAGADPLEQDAHPLAPAQAVAATLRRATRTLHDAREQQRAQMSSAKRLGQLATAAERLEAGYRRFGEAVAGAPTGAQEASDVQAVATAARQAAAAYDVLAQATTDEQWNAARTRALSREDDLDAALKRLKRLGYVVSTGR